MPLLSKKKSKRGRRPLRFKRFKKGVTAGVKKYVKRAIHANIENKIQNIDAVNSFGSTQEDPNLGAYPMMPYTGLWTISQNVLQNGRVGNRIRPVKVVLNYVLTPNAYSAISNPNPYPVVVDLFLGYHRQNPSLLPNSGLFNELFQRGNSQVAPQGLLDDVIADVNRDAFVVLKRWQHRVFYADAVGTGSNANAQYHANNDFKMCVMNKLNITKYVPKRIFFNDSGAMTNRGLFLWYQAVPATGGVGAAGIQPATMRFWVHFEYEDA